MLYYREEAFSIEESTYSGDTARGSVVNCDGQRCLSDGEVTLLAFTPLILGVLAIVAVVVLKVVTHV